MEKVNEQVLSNAQDAANVVGLVLHVVSLLDDAGEDNFQMKAAEFRSFLSVMDGLIAPMKKDLVPGK